jgi:HSP20 family molecular chaperone IbpA
MERSYGSFSRLFRLPGPVDAEAIAAQFKDGLLRLELPKLVG